MDELLPDVPVEMAVVGVGQQGPHALRCLVPRFQRDVEVGRADALQIGQGRGVLRWSLHADRLQGGQRHDRVAHGGREVLAKEGAERDVLPGLDVAGGPIVDEDEALDVAVGFRHGDGAAPLGIA